MELEHHRGNHFVVNCKRDVNVFHTKHVFLYLRTNDIFLYLAWPINRNLWNFQQGNIDMAKSSTEVAIEGLKRLLSDKEGLDEIAAAKIEKLTADLQEQDHEEEFDPVRRIKDGFIHFKIHHFDKYPDYYNQLAEGQHPKPLSCPQLQAREAFMCRNIANMVPAFNQLRYSGVGAVIEYAVKHLEVENILVIGHSRCGGIQALMSLPADGTTSNDFIDDWVKIGLPAKAKVESEWSDATFEEQCEHCEKESVNLSLVNLLSYPYVRAALANRALKLMGGYYDFVNGTFGLWKADFDIRPEIII
ncbi:Carbonic anhydrase, chloroplastic [Vitis vinifera]|uniref:Carbonic anhydrase n=1 Tax=Vitis vinifera TaxID=29760 RepID=A0A438EZJ2_VITVI|nr:Carbonic anhydrase, chloroplastic [Vitis vinifera]